MIRIPVSQPALIGREKEYVLDCLESNWISSNGKYVELLERKFAAYLGVRHAVACSNGTAALHLALLALGIGPGDEVIVPTLTYVATANAVTYTGAYPVLADCEPDTWNLDPAKIESLITPRTKAVVPVPLYGHPCDMSAILELARKYRLYVIEDAAEALGSRYKGQLCGTMADISTFSFYGNKTITTGEGGMVVTDDDGLAARIRLLKGQGMDLKKRYWFPILGYNYRMTNVQAAIGCAQMENIGDFLEKRLQIAEWYADALSGIRGITLPIVKNYANHSWWMFSILVDDKFGMSRDALIDRLEQFGIETRPFFYPMHFMPVYEGSNRCDLINSSLVSVRGLNLPTYFNLTRDLILEIANSIKKISRE